ncbi:hypothetical protein Lepto7375DRAFT_6500 [Leptolyngbya sp. PCC 7375]|nr:hypothetical protein Lepto7375DRAFT_6500 [Leptolyngbya sp. PCC 7375]
MTKAYIVVEGPSDAQILRALLDETLLEDVKFINGEGKYGAETMARSLLLDRHIPVLLVIDADTSNPDAIHSYQQDLDFLTRSAAVGTPYKILQAIPTIEAVFLQDRLLFEQLIGRQFSDLEWQLGQKAPKELLSQYSEGAKSFIQTTLSQLDDPTKHTLSQHPLIQDITTFLTTQVHSSDRVARTAS